MELIVFCLMSYRAAGTFLFLFYNSRNDRIMTVIKFLLASEYFYCINVYFVKYVFKQNGRSVFSSLPSRLVIVDSLHLKI